ncbi:MAG TPA: DUF1127 domain-containing protein [Rhodopila sp.]|jgi:uncharacterized protein YjiS (DUF1127 family)|nr:DUF1127 domain-containing protein [Rhodopila sp.]
MFAQRVIALPGRSMAAGHARPDFPTRLQRARKWMARAWRNKTTRHYLTEMDDRTLADLGISRAQAEFEASRWMWN